MRKFCILKQGGGREGIVFLLLKKGFQCFFQKHQNDLKTLLLSQKVRQLQKPRKIFDKKLIDLGPKAYNPHR